MRFLDREQARLDREPCWHHPAGPGGGRAAACCMPVGAAIRDSGKRFEIILIAGNC